MMKINEDRTQKGFTLIEVMLSVLILGIGILAVSKLQGSLIRNGADANQRSIAANLVQKKTDDLRRFIHITTTGATPDNWVASITSPNSLAYTHISDNEGGLVAPTTITIGNIEYGLSWSVENYYYSGTDSKATTTPSGAPYPSYKTVHIVAKWDSVGNLNNVVSFDTIISAYSPAFTALSNNNTSTGNDGPIIPYDPQQQPDVVPITISSDGVKKETSKPLPDLSKKGDSTSVKFETVTYSNNLDTVKREEFRTLVCNCKTGPTNNVQIYGLTTWDNTLETIIDVTTTRTASISKTVVDNGGGENQANECFICCRDGDVTTGASPTFKVCRMKRVDGILRLFDPWKMVAFNVIPASYFNDSNGLSGMTTTLQTTNISTYSNYVTSLVRSVLNTTGSPGAYNSYTTVDTFFVNNTSNFTNGIIDHKSFVRHNTDNNRPIQARAIYMDYPPTGVFSKITNQTTFYSAGTVPLDRIPFFEVNMTELAGWIPDRDNTAFTTYTSDHDNISNSPSCNPAAAPSRSYVTNDAIESGCETNYSRGEFFPKVAGTTTVTTRIFTNSDGVIDRNINSGNTAVDSSIGLTVVP